MKRILTLLLSFLAMTSFAQNEMKELKARLVDEEKKPVQFANVSLKMADNDSIIAGTSSDENVNFYSNVEVQAVWEKFNIGCDFDITPHISLYGETLTYSEMSQDIYAQYKYKDLYVTLTWWCPFNKDGFKYETEGLSEIHPYRHANWTANNGNMLSLGLSWKINYGKSFKKVQKSLSNGGYDNGMVKPGE